MREGGQAADPGSLVEGAVSGVEDPAEGPALDHGRKLARLAPLDGEPVGDERVRFGSDRGQLVFGVRDSKAADASERLAGERADAIEGGLGGPHDVRQG